MGLRQKHVTITVMRTDQPLTPGEKMAAYRARMRAQGFRPVQIWVHDTHSETFRKEARRQSLMIAGDRQDTKMTKALEALADTEGWSA